jgi:AraC family transcriptional regulator
VPSRAGHLYIDPATPLADAEIGFADIEFTPTLYSTDLALWTTASKILRLVNSYEGSSRLYAETLTSALTIELLRLRPGGEALLSVGHGGLAAWQLRIVRDFINESLDRDISLGELAALVRLSPTHFCRSFTQSMGIPPHQYHLAVGMGFSASSNFSTVPPNNWHYRRSRR